MNTYMAIRRCDATRELCKDAFHRCEKLDSISYQERMMLSGKG